MADIICIENLLKKYSLKKIEEASEVSEVSYNTLKKMKYGERKLTSLNLGIAIKLTTLWYKWENEAEMIETEKNTANESTWFDE